jgi:hypothetical protein
MPLKQRKAVQQRVRREAMMFIPPPSNPRVDDLNAELERCKQELIESMRIPEHLIREEVVQPGVVRRKVC